MSSPTDRSFAPFGPHFHACAFVLGRDEQDALVERFFAEGMRRGEKAMCIVDPAQRDRDEARLRAHAPSPDLAEAYDAESALEIWRDTRPVAAVFDVGMPGTNGYDLARAVRREFGASPLLIAATGYGQPRDRALATEAGFDAHFVKPVSIQDLVRVLDQRVVRLATPRGDATV